MLGVGVRRRRAHEPTPLLAKGSVERTDGRTFEARPMGGAMVGEREAMTT
jgi:hypothetical protein